MKSMDGSDNDGLNDASFADLPQFRTPDLERIRNARRQREKQLKDWLQYDKKMSKRGKSLQYNGRNEGSSGRFVKFSKSLIFLEAAARGDLEEVRKLLINGACPNVANEDGLTALHQCCIDNSPEMCRLLLRYNADPNARDTELWTPLHAAATCEHFEICQILIENRADLLAMNADGNMPYECCQPGPTLSLIENAMDMRGVTQEDLDDLHRKPECDMLSDMEKLVKSGADLNLYDNQGATMLHIAAACGFEEVALFLLKHGAKVDQPDRDGWQAVHIAACWGHFDIIEVLVHFGANIMASTVTGETVFDICEDAGMRARLIEIKEEAERQHTKQEEEDANWHDKPKELVRRRSSTNPRSSSIRRTSMRDKKMISRKEAKQEAEMRGLVTLDVTALPNQVMVDPDKSITPQPDNAATISPRLHVSIPDDLPVPSSPGMNIRSPDTIVRGGERNTSLRNKQTLPSDPYHTKSGNGIVSQEVNKSSQRHHVDRGASTGPPSTRINVSDRPPPISSVTVGSIKTNDPRSLGKPTTEFEAQPMKRPVNNLTSQLSASNVSPIKNTHLPKVGLQNRDAGSIPTQMASSYDNAIVSPDLAHYEISRSSLPEPLRSKTESVKRRQQPPPGDTYHRTKQPESLSPILSTHNAYFTPPPFTAHRNKPPVNSVRAPLTEAPGQLVTYSSSVQSQTARQMVSARPVVKSYKRLIEYDIETSASGKCCSVM